MEASKEAISVRVARINNQLLGKSQQTTTNLLTRESLLDALTVLYDECNTDALKRSDKFIASFVEKFRQCLTDLKQVRVNISDFEVKNMIGRGHYGEVHVVRERQTGDVYAMKTIRKSDSLKPNASSYAEERDIMALNQSPWLTALQYAFQDFSHLYLVMEFHSGGDLYGLLDRQGGILLESHATFYLSELIQAIHALHVMGYCHRDVKPDNVLLDRCGHLKLADFGSAAKLSKTGTVIDKDVKSVGTPAYVAPEVLLAIDNINNKKYTYGSSCDYWSLGVLAYELTLGDTPFAGVTIPVTYNKIMNHASSILKFPKDSTLSTDYTSLIKQLLVDQHTRLDYKQLLKHALFKETDWSNLHNQVPPFVPKVNGVDDTSNFLEIDAKKPPPSIENFKTKTQFTGRNLPFVGFTFTQNLPDLNQSYATAAAANYKNGECLLESKKKQVVSLQKRLAQVEHSSQEFDRLEKKLEDGQRKLESVENVRNSLEKELATSIAESSALRRTLDLERTERKILETRALELIKDAKTKWELAEKHRVEKLMQQIDDQTAIITKLITTNNELTCSVQRCTVDLEKNETELKLLKQLETEHRESLAKARAFSRQSVAGVENRLERMNSETQMQMNELKEKLSMVYEDKHQLEDEILTYKQRELELEEQYNISKELCQNLREHLNQTAAQCKDFETELTRAKCKLEDFDILKQELNVANTEIQRLRNDNKLNKLEEALRQGKDKCNVLKLQLKSLSDSLNDTIASKEASQQEKDEQSEKEMHDLQAKLRKASEEKEELNRRIQEAQDRDNANKIKVQSLENLLSRLESGVTKLETSSDREHILQEQVKRLEDQIKELHEQSALEKQSTRTANTSLWRKEKELSNCELDKRILERELKSSGEKIQELESEIAAISHKFDAQVLEHRQLLETINHDLETAHSELRVVEQKSTGYRQEMLEFQNLYKLEKQTVDSLRADLKKLETKIEEIGKKLEVEVKAKNYIERELHNVRENNIKLHYSMDMAKKGETDARNELEACKRELDNSNLNINVLRDACTLLENQLEDYENLISAHKKKESSLDSTILTLNAEVAQMKSTLQTTKCDLNEEKSLKFQTEAHYKQLQNDFEVLQDECNRYKLQVEEYNTITAQLNQHLSGTEENCNRYETELKKIERMAEGLKHENIQLKEEISQRITHIHDIRESNYKLNEAIIEIKGENSQLLAKMVELEDSLNELNHFYKQRELKSDGTIQQQTKLIDFLQSKVEDSKKKKTLSDKLFGSTKKENIPPSLALNYRDLEAMLMKERETNRTLREEVVKLKSSTYKNQGDVNLAGSGDKRKTPPNSPKTKLILEQLVRSPASQTTDFQRKPSVQRMHHNIPHRFESRLSKKTTKCSVCADSILIGRSASVCRECSVTVHPKCSSQVPRTCGLPKEYAKHFKRSLSSSTEIQQAKQQPVESNETAAATSDVIIEGWVKIPTRGKSGGWEKKFARLEDSILAIYEHKPTSNLAPVLTSDLCPQDGWGLVFSDVDASEIGNIATTDVPFIFKIEIHPKTTCWPPTSQLLMTLNAQDKEKWVNSINELFQRKYPEFNRNNFTTVLKLAKPLEIVCIQEITKNVLLLGCEEGLWVSNQGTLTHITGVTNIQQILILKSINYVLMIVGTNRALIKTEFRHLESLTKSVQSSNPTLKSEKIAINQREGFHLVESSDFRKTQIVCAATNKQLFILKYEYDLADFTPIRVLDTAEPCSCILFNEHSVIVGANKFFEIDLKTFGADEFLDASDHTLKNAIQCYKLGSYPIAVMKTNSNPCEYLLCFSEFGVFIDEYGRKLRENELKWSHLPVAFAYCRPFLYVIQFAAIEITRIAPENYGDSTLSSWIAPDCLRIELNKPKFLGACRNNNGVYIKVENEVLLVNAKVILGEDSLSDLSISDPDSDVGTEFSFSSSIVRALDQESTDESGKIQTDL